MPAPTPAIDQLDVAVTALESAVATPAEVSSSEARFEALVPIRRRLDAVSARLAARASDQLVHQRSGHKDEVQWLARTAGVSRRTAKD
ncbi:MAG: hypothetical protein OES57_01990 [Acidimicrobiia bacterium]|nr:hypothetical protein [Acidimicrobiia bacterium]